VSFPSHNNVICLFVRLSVRPSHTVRRTRYSIYVKATVHSIKTAKSVTKLFES